MNYLNLKQQNYVMDESNRLLELIISCFLKICRISIKGVFS